MKLFSKKQKETGEEQKMDALVSGSEEQQEKDKTQEVMAYIRKRNPRKKKKVIKIAIAVVLLVAVVGGVAYAKSAGNSQGMMLATVPVERGDVEQDVSTSGTVESENVQTYFSDVAAPVSVVSVKAGDTVNMGDTLLVYDTETLAMENEQAKLTASSTKKKLQAQLEEGSLNELKFATSAVEVGNYDAQIADLEARIDQVYCMINSNKKWMSDEGARLEGEIAELESKKTSVSKNSAKDHYQNEINSRREEINKHGTADLEEYLRQGQDELAKLKEGRSESEGTLKSSESGILSGTEKSEISDESRLAELNAQETAANLSKASKGVSANFAGIVTDVQVIEGSVTTPGTQLFTIADSQNVKVTLKVSKYDLEYIREGQSADVTIAGYDYTGKVTRIDRMAQKNDSGTAVVSAEIHIDKPDDNIFLGIEAKAVIHIAKAKDALMIPVEVVNSSADGYYCYIVNNGVVERRELEIGISSDTYVEVVNGLEEGDQVVQNAAMELEEGMPAVALGAMGAQADAEGAGTGISENEVSGNEISSNSVSEDSTLEE